MKITPVIGIMEIFTNHKPPVSAGGLFLYYTLKMKNTLLVILFFLGFLSHAQLTQDFESGNRNQERANCWQFNGFNINGGSNVIAGRFSAKSDNLNNANSTPEVISPWVSVTQNTQASFKYSRENSSTSNVRVQVIAISTTGGEQVVWGPQPVNSNVDIGTFNITLNGDYQFQFEFLSGGGGNTRGLLDDIFIPGVYASDPSVNPSGNGNCGLLETCPDQDGDGVCDDDDDYPTDPDLAYNNYYPSEFQIGAVAFEDLWPSYGDFDFNDLVVLYRYNTITNAGNDAAKCVWDFYVRAVGASKNFAFGVMLDQVSQAQISGVTGYNNTGNVTLNGNGTEAGQTNAVIFPFDDVNSVINRPGGSFYNTIPGNPTGISDTLQIIIDFVSPINPSYLLAQAPYNPFVFTDNIRGNELHLVDGEPTALADPSYFGTDKDNSNPASGKYY